MTHQPPLSQPPRMSGLFSCPKGVCVMRRAVAVILAGVALAVAAVLLTRPPVHVDVAPAGPPPPATFTITGRCTVTATHDGQTVTHGLDGQTVVELATPGSITAPGCTIK